MKQQFKITINASFGSEFQETMFLKTLRVMLKALKMNLEEWHKQNSISYEIKGDGYKIEKV